jgi:hypothetical protein
MEFRRGGSVTENLTVAGNFIGVLHFFPENQRLKMKLTKREVT